MAHTRQTVVTTIWIRDIPRYLGPPGSIPDLHWRGSHRSSRVNANGHATTSTYARDGVEKIGACAWTDARYDRPRTAVPGFSQCSLRRHIQPGVRPSHRVAFLRTHT